MQYEELETEALALLFVEGQRYEVRDSGLVVGSGNGR